MRKWLVKNFVLSFSINLFGRTYNAPRASRIIFPLFILTGIANGLNDDWPTPTPLIWVLYSLVAIALFFGFTYFRLYPIKWEELDRYQKYQYGFIKPFELSDKQYREWIYLSREYNK